MKRRISYLIAGLLSLVTLVFAPVSASAATTQLNTYVAVGDSIAAGAGLPLMDSSTETKACGRSDQAYPHLVAAAKNIPLNHIACGGATVKEGLINSQNANGLTVPAQIDRAFANGVPKMMSISIGTNDLHWSDFIKKCYAGTCGTWSDSAALAGLDFKLYYNLNKAMHQIQTKSAGTTPPKVYIVGYYHPYDTTKLNCMDTQGITTDEASWVNRQADVLNGVLTITAAQYGATYVPANFAGHELCSASPWIQGITAPASYHPTAAGQAAIAQSINSL
jgi:lysophospholipase L1-like esterase